MSFHQAWIQKNFALAHVPLLSISSIAIIPQNRDGTPLPYVNAILKNQDSPFPGSYGNPAYKPLGKWNRLSILSTKSGNDFASKSAGITFVEIAVDTNDVRNWHIQNLGFVVVLGGEADLKPVVEMDAPGRGCLAQLVKLAQTSVGHANSKCLAVPVKAHLPVVFSTIDQCVSCGTARKWPWKPDHWGESHKVPLNFAALHAQPKQKHVDPPGYSCITDKAQTVGAFAQSGGPTVSCKSITI